MNLASEYAKKFGTLIGTMKSIIYFIELGDKDVNNFKKILCDALKKVDEEYIGFNEKGTNEDK